MAQGVRPQLGQLMYSVFEMRVRVACRIPKEVELTAPLPPEGGMALLSYGSWRTWATLGPPPALRC